MVGPTEPKVHAIGIDLAWGNNPTGVAHLIGPAPGTGNTTPWRLVEARTVPSVRVLVEWLRGRLPADASVWIAVDAPLLATNREGTQRAADQALANAFRRFRVSCFPVDQRHATQGAELVRHLAEDNVAHALPTAASETRRGIFETFPTAAQLSFFDLTRPIRYKRGMVDQRREGLRSLQLRLAMMEDAAVPLEDGGSLQRLLRTDPGRLQGAGLKRLEDELDALLCGLVAALAWSAPSRLLVYGDLDHGAIVVPHPPVPL